MAATRSSERPRAGTHDAIVEAALECFDRGGIAATSMEEIAAAAGLTRPALYYHFAGKRELVLEVLVRRGAEIHERIGEEIAYRPATAELIVTANLRAVELSLDDPIARQLASAENEHLTAELLRSERMLPVHRAFWLPLLTAAREAGELRTDLDLGEIVNWMVFLQFSLASLGPDFGLHGDRLRCTLESFLAPALGPG